MNLLADLSVRVQGALRPLASPMVLRRAEALTCKAVALAPAGATSITLSVPSGTAGLLAGDTFSGGGTATKAVTADAPASGGGATVTFTPALTTQIAAGALVTVNRTIPYACMGWEEGVDVTRVQNSLIAATDTAVNVLVDSLATAPKNGDVVNPSGRLCTVKSVARDGIGAVWRLIAGT